MAGIILCPSLARIRKSLMTGVLRSRASPSNPTSSATPTSTSESLSTNSRETTTTEDLKEEFCCCSLSLYAATYSVFSRVVYSRVGSHF